MDDGFYLAAFDSTSHCMQTDKLAVGKFRAAVIPTPTEITSGCGFSLRFYEGTEESLTEFMGTIGVPAKFYHMGPIGADGLRPLRLILST